MYVYIYIIICNNNDNNKYIYIYIYIYMCKVMIYIYIYIILEKNKTKIQQAKSRWNIDKSWQITIFGRSNILSSCTTYKYIYIYSYIFHPYMHYRASNLYSICSHYLKLIPWDVQSIERKRGSCTRRCVNMS